MKLSKELIEKFQEVLAQHGKGQISKVEAEVQLKELAELVRLTSKTEQQL